MKKRFLLIIICILCVAVAMYTNVCYASVAVTDENLTNALQAYEKSDVNEDEASISVSNNTITIIVDGQTYTVNYDLTDKPTFTLTVPISAGMTYETYENSINGLTYPLIGYISTCYIQGVDFKDSMTYFELSYLSSLFTLSSSSTYTILDDTQLEEGVSIGEVDENTILVSEFGDKVMDYVASIYGSTKTISDANDGINSYVWTIERQNVTDTSCDIVSTISVNLDADFSSLEGYYNTMAESLLNSDITEENADYVINLKVGQRCVINSNNDITGYSVSGTGSVEFSDDRTIITAEDVGIINGYLYIGDETKTIYIIITENTENETLNDVTIQITTNSISAAASSSGDASNGNNIISSSSGDNTTLNSTLPQTGERKAVYGIIVAIIISSIIFVIKIKKYNT